MGYFRAGRVETRRHRLDTVVAGFWTAVLVGGVILVASMLPIAPTRDEALRAEPDAPAASSRNDTELRVDHGLAPGSPIDELVPDDRPEPSAALDDEQSDDTDDDRWRSLASLKRALTRVEEGLTGFRATIDESIDGQFASGLPQSSSLVAFGTLFLLGGGGLLYQIARRSTTPRPVIPAPQREPRGAERNHHRRGRRPFVPEPQQGAVRRVATPPVVQTYPVGNFERPSARLAGAAGSGRAPIVARKREWTITGLEARRRSPTREEAPAGHTTVRPGWVNVASGVTVAVWGFSFRHDAGRFDPAPPGFHFVVMELAVANGTTTSIHVNPLNVTLVDEHGFSQAYHPATHVWCTVPLGPVDAPPGTCVQGGLVFLIRESTIPAALIYRTSTGAEVIVDLIRGIYD